MHEYHSSFLEPVDKNVKIWRYMDFQKLMSIIDRKSLFFVKASKLFDPFEGSLPKFNRQIENREAVYSRTRGNFASEEQYRFFVNSYANMGGYERRKPITLINSWHISEYESAAMWDLYSHRNAGAAIQSTFKRLSDCLKDNTSDTVWIGKVNYMDFEKEWLNEGNLYDAFMAKRKPFEHERELRAITSLPLKSLIKSKADRIREKTNPTPKRIIDPNQVTDSGKFVPVNLDILIERIYISPLAAPWFGDLVRSLLGKFSIDPNKIIKSDLYDLS
jgi:hypothetical protein